MNSYNRKVIIALLVMITILSGLTFFSCQRRTDYDFFDHEEEGTSPHTRSGQTRSRSSYRGFFWRNTLYLILWIPLSLYVASYWKKHGHNYWVGLFISLIISPIIAWLLCYLLGLKSEKERAQEIAYETITKYGYTPKGNNPMTITDDRENILKSTLIMVPVKGGKFLMGGADDQTETEKSAPEETIKDFFLCKYLVTQKLWREIMGNYPSEFRGDDLPVESISWYKAIEFCNKLSLLEGFTPVYTITKKQHVNPLGFESEEVSVTANDDADGYRLPTEAEWEYAASGGHKKTKTMYAGSDQLIEVAWFDRNSGGKTNSIGQKNPNELGLFDMSGNVWEWCWDRYEEDRSEADGKKTANLKVVRGGSWEYGPVRCRVDHRFFKIAAGRYSDVGFRPARNGSVVE